MPTTLTAFNISCEKTDPTAPQARTFFMMLVLPVLAYVLFLQIFRSVTHDWRQAVLAASILWGTSLTLITELLSFQRIIAPHTLAACWAALCVAAIIYLIGLMPRSRVAEPYQSLRSSSSEHNRLATATKILIAFAGTIVALVATVAIIAPPSSWDAMQTYLPRVMLWISNRSVDFYPTPDYLQLVLAPWPSYAMMHSILLFGSDRFVNLIQTFSLLGSAIAVSLIAKHLGAKNTGQALAAIVSLTIPQGVLEASGALNSYVVSFWIATTIAFLLMFKDHPTWFNTINGGLAAGLALLSKGQAYMFLPFMALVCWWMAPPSNRLIFLKQSYVIIAAILLINGPTFSRNYELTGSLLGLPIPEPFRQSMLMDSFSASTIVANTIRHVSAHFGTPIDAINAPVTRGVRNLISALGVDPDRSIYEGDTFHVPRFSRHEISAGNPIHFALFVITGLIALALFIRQRPGWREPALYIVGICLAFVFMSATLIWQTTTSRYHLPLFVLGSAVIGLVLDKFCSRRLSIPVIAALIALGSICAVTNRTRSLVPSSHGVDVYRERAYLYFADLHEQDFPIHAAVAAAVNKLTCRNIGIDAVLPKAPFRDSKGSLFVYPIMALTNPSGRAGTVSYTGVQNLTARYPKASDERCAVICFNCAALVHKADEYRAIGPRASVFQNIVVFSADEKKVNAGAALKLR